MFNDQPSRQDKKIRGIEGVVLLISWFSTALFSCGFVGKHFFRYFTDDPGNDSFFFTYDFNTYAALEKVLNNESQLLHLIASGDESAFRQIFEIYKPRLVSYLTTFTKSQEEAKELTQDVFLKIWMNREKLSAIESPQNYIFTIARNNALDFLRRASVDGKMRDTIWQTLSEHQELGEDEVSRTNKTQRIHEAMHKLSRQRRTVFHLSRIDGLTHDQIALRLSISKNTVKNHIVASVKFIRNYVAHHY